MSTIIGTIKAVMGQVWIVASDGSRRLATEGEQIMRGELVVTDQGAATVTLPNGKNMDLGRGSEWGDGAVAASASGGADEQAIAAAQQAIAEGADPTQILEATAAGNSTIIDSSAEPTGAHNGHSHVILDLTGEILDPTAGYPTQGLDAATIVPVEEVTLLRPELDNSSDDPITPPPPQPLPEASITIDVIAGDNVINMNEAAQEKTVISGTTGLDVHPGDIVTVTVNGNSYQTLVAADGRWSVEVNTHDLVASGEVHASVTTFDQYGNQASASAESAVALDITAPNVSLHIDVISGDGFINTAEAAKPTTTISGTVGGDAKAGDVVHLEVNGTDYIAQVVAGEGGKLVWQTEVATSDLLADPQVNGSITIRDAAGNEATAVDSESVVIDTTAPAVTLHIDVISDGYINANESKESTTTVKGIVGGDAKAGDIVHLEVNGTNYTATVVAGEGSALVWQTEVATSDLLADPIVNGSITIKDAAGNEATAIDDESVVIDTTAPVVTLHIDVISGDGYINAVESKEPTTTVKGTVGGDAKAGDVVHLEVNGTDYSAQVVAGEGGKLVWQTEVATSDLLADPQVNGSITIRDEAGNEATDTDDESVKIDTTPPVVELEIDVISGDGYINADEAEKPTTTISGTVGGDAKAGDVVQLEVNGNKYTAEVVAGEGGKLVWQTEVATSDLIADKQVNGSITITDEAGNEATATDDETVKIDTTPPVVELEIDIISGDGFINADEAEKTTTTISGTVGGDAKAGDIVQLEVNGNKYTAEVVADKDGRLVWQTEVATSDLIADKQVNGSITITDEAGNEATATDDETVKIDTTPPVVTLEIDVISGDGFINADEAEKTTTTISGTVGGDAKAGDVVQLEVNGNKYTAEVVAGEGGKLVWQTEVATSDLLADKQVNGSITITDEAGNEATATDDETVKIDTIPPVVELEIDVISGDGYINADEAEKPTTTISGTVGGDAEAGDVVQLEVNGNKYTAEVVADKDGKLVWQTEVATSDLIADKQVNGSITITDEAGNEATATDDETVKIDTTPPVVTLEIDVISGDGFINADEAAKPTTTISGTVGGDAKAGDVVHLEVNDKTYTAEVYADKDGKLVWQTEVTTSDLINDPQVNGTITIRDEAGNEATATDDESVKIDTTPPVVALEIDTISGDGFINADEAGKPTTTISGTVGGDAKAGDVVHLEVNEKAYTAEVYADKDGKLVWQTEVTTSDLIYDPQVNGTITIRDEAGNTATATDDESVKIDTTPPVVTLEIDTISDGYINAAESKEPTTTVKGTVGGDAKAGDVVHLEVNDKAYTAEVYADKDGKLVWQTEVTTSDLINDPQVNGTITITDEAGNTATATDDESVKIDTTPPVVTLEIDTISGDGFINADEAAKPTTTISGTVGGDAKAGDVVHLEVNDKAYTAEVYADKDGKLVWQTEVTTSDLIYDPQVNGTITIRDEAGNTATATDDESVKIDTTPPVVTLEIDTISDGYINAAESKEPTTTVKGTVGGDAKAGDVVHLEVNGNEYTAEVYADKDGKLVWQTEVATSDLLADPEVNGSITIKDAAGNEATDIDDESVIIDTTAPVVTLDIDVISDGYINAAEAEKPTTNISGTVGGDAKAGDVVHLEINGKDYPATVVAGEDGALVWQTKVATSDLLADPIVNGTITIKDAAGNEATAIDDETVVIDTTAPVVTLHIDVISDGYINAAESKEPTTTVKGTVGGDAKAGDVVHLEVNDRIYTAEVYADKDGKLVWQTDIATSDLLKDPLVNGTITITDEAGNKATAIDKETVIIDTEITVTVTIDPVTGDDFLSFAETNQLPGKSEPLIKVTGTVTGEAKAGDIVDVKVGDVTQKVTLTDDGKGNLVWEAEFKASNMMNNPKVSASISISDPAGNTASDSTSRPVTIETGNLITGDEKNNVINGGDTSDIIIADTQGFQQLPGQDYNIAFVVDSSGSVGATDIKSIIASLTTVFNALHQNAQLVNSGDVKILLVDFDAQVNFAVSVNLKDSGALKTLTDALAKMTSGGGTNYEDAFKTTSNWFHDVSSSSSENLTYFITDGKPTYYQSGEKTSVDVDGRSGNNNVVMLDVTKLDYHPGQVVSMNINGTSRVVIDASGNVYSWNGSTRTSVGIMRADGKGGYEISVRAGSGSSTTTDTTTNSTYAFGLLMAMCGNVEAIGINNGIKASDLIAYDSDGKVTAGISASELANAILGGDYVQMAGAQDTVHGNGGNDVIFGDMLQFGDKTGYAAIQEYVAGKLNIAVNQLEVSHIAQYISEHPAEFDQSQADGGRDVLFGGVGNDILYGGGGDDILVGGSGDDVLFGGKGDDILIGDGFDSMADMASHLNTSVNQLTFDKVVDYVTQHSEELGAIGSGNDKLYGGEGNDLLMGGGGNDILNGGEGNDLLFGGTGNDVLIGGKGNDTLYGGTGSDTFTWLKGDDGHDVIKDFRADEGDRIDLSDLLGDVANTDLASYIKVTDDNHGNTVIEINTNGQMQSGSSTMSITVENCTSADIDINSLIAKPDAPVI